MGVADMGRVVCEKDVAAVFCDIVDGGLFDGAVSTGECVDILLVVAESNCPNSLSTVVESVGKCSPLTPSPAPAPPTSTPPPTTGDPAPPPVRSEFCRLVAEKFMLPASLVSRGCLILLSRTCCSRSASLFEFWSLLLPRPNMRDFRRFSDVTSGEVTSLVVKAAGLRFAPNPRRRKIFRLRPPSGRSGMRVDSRVYESD